MKKLFQYLREQINPPVAVNITSGPTEDGQSITVQFSETIHTRLPLPNAGDRIWYKHQRHFVLWKIVNFTDNHVQLGLATNDPTTVAPRSM